MRDRCGSLALQIILLLLAILGWKALAQTDTPDVILVNGHVFTATDSHPYAQAIAIKGSRILAVGTNQEILSMADSKAQRIDLRGRLVIPGINDGHVHFDEYPKGISVDFGGADPTCAHVMDQLGQVVQNAPRGVLLTGSIDINAFFDSGCTSASLTRIAPDDPVVLWTPTLHAAILNQTAARKFNIGTGDRPVLGGWFGKDMKSQHWDGVVHEYAWFRIFETLPSDRAAEEARLRRFLEREVQWGVTSITLIEPKPTRRMKMLSTVDTPVRVRVVPSPLTEANRRIDPEYPSVPPRLAGRVSVSGVKWWLDGSPFERSCGMRAPYADDPATSGQINFSPEEIRGILEEAGQRNTQVLFHTVGDRTAETLLRALETTGGADTWAQRRLRIEHGDGLLPDLIPRARALGVIVVQNPTHLRGGDLFIRRFGPDRAALASPLRSLLTAGVKLVLASDGAADEPALNPYLNIMLASEYPGKPHESLTREQAVIAYTRTAAYAEFAEDRKGTLEPGKVADLAVLSQDIFKVAGEELPNTESVLTMVNGQVVYMNRAKVKE